MRNEAAVDRLAPGNQSPGSLPVRLLPFALYLAGIFVFAALLAYPLWLLITALGGEGIRFHKLTFRLLEAAALIGLWPLMAHLKLDTKANFGVGSGYAAGPWQSSRVGGLCVGFAAGVAVLAAIVAALLLLKVRIWRTEGDVSEYLLATVLFKAVVAGLAVAFVEELWFRGALQRAFERQIGLRFAITGTALLYALVHFIRPDVTIPAAEVNFGSGFAVIAGSFGRFSDPRILDSLTALFAVGVFLSLVRWRSGRIWECIGLHAGFVTVIKISAKLTILSPAPAHRYLAGSFNGIVGVLACAVFAFLALAYWRLGKPGRVNAE